MPSSKLHLDHVAVLTDDLMNAAASLPESCTFHDKAQYPFEGTCEQYVSLPGEGAPSLLLMEAISEGPYMKAMRKRGTGLHHLGFLTGSIDELLGGDLAGLLLHPVSLKTCEKGVIWLCRPGVPFLLEVMEGKRKTCSTELLLPECSREARRLNSLFINFSVAQNDDSKSTLRTEGISCCISSPCDSVGSTLD